ISARALTREETASLVRKTAGFIGETLISSLSLVKKDLEKKDYILKKCRIFIYIYYNIFNSSLFDLTRVISVRLRRLHRLRSG
ncbi:hypothetical protein, partial [Peptoniphilus duerdenii]|uniref:hypothetical protein n=1 Tax=Peptoniphilus duerdenii TaxID=507750 RepID=UPI0023F2785D